MPADPEDAAPLWPLAFEPEQTDELRARLAEILHTPEGVNDAVAAIDYAASFVVTGKAREFRKWREANHAHMRAVVKTSEALRRLLRSDRPHWDTGDLDWNAVDGTLNKISESAQIEVAAGARHLRRGRGAGRPANTWNDNLVEVISSVYPPAPRPKQRSPKTHFEETVEMVFGYLDIHLENVRKYTVGALLRRPEPPLLLPLVRDLILNAMGARRAATKDQRPISPGVPETIAGVAAGQVLVDAGSLQQVQALTAELERQLVSVSRKRPGRRHQQRD